MEALIKVSRRINNQNELIGMLLINSEKDFNNQIKNFCWSNGVDPNKYAIVIEEIPKTTEFKI